MPIDDVPPKPKPVAAPGRIVHVLNAYGRTLPAVVVLSNQNGFADLAVFTGDVREPVMTALSIEYDPTGTKPGTWRWPPRVD